MESFGLWFQVSFNQNNIWNSTSVLLPLLINHGTLEPGEASETFFAPTARPLHTGPNPTVTSRQKPDSPQRGPGRRFGQVLRTGNGAKKCLSEFA